MRGIGIAFAVGVALLLSACGGSASTPVTQPTTQSNEPSALPGYVDCGAQRPRLKPSKLLTRCADKDFRISGVRWSSWGHQAAIGKGTAHLECGTACVPGDPQVFPIRIELSLPQTCGKSVPQFTLSTLRIIGRKPTHTGRTLTYRSSCRLPP